MDEFFFENPRDSTWEEEATYSYSYLPGQSIAIGQQGC